MESMEDGQAVPVGELLILKLELQRICLYATMRIPRCRCKLSYAFPKAEMKSGDRDMHPVAVNSQFGRI
jgi:hypothetical protein